MSRSSDGGCDEAPYFLNVYQDGTRSMDRVINPEDTSESTEYRLRPVSGVRCHFKRNHITQARKSEVIQSIGSMSAAIKRLDLSFNRMKKYPMMISEIKSLELLNLSGNNLDENDLTIEAGQCPNLLELILDYNEFKQLPKKLSSKSSKNIIRLSMRHNQIDDLRGIEAYKRLRVLLLERNSISNFDESLTDLVKLEILDLRENQVTKIPANMFKQKCFMHLKELNLSFNRISHVPGHLFMLPNIQYVNLANNHLNKLPFLAPNFVRPIPINLIDLSSNKIHNFYEYLINIAESIDLTSNRIRKIPEKQLNRFAESQLASKTLKIDFNPLVEPPIELLCHPNARKSTLCVIKEYYDELNRQTMTNKGFKLIVLGEPGSGKTNLAYAIENFNSQMSLVETFETMSDKDARDNEMETRFVEIHNFYMFTQFDKEIESQLNEESYKRSKTPVSMFEFNGNLKTFGPFLRLVVDTKSLILLCIDAKKLADQSTQSSVEMIRANLDFLISRLTKNTLFLVIPVLCKCDLVVDQTDKLLEITNKTIHDHLSQRLEDVKNDIKQIESLGKISQAKSDSLKQLIQLRTLMDLIVFEKCMASSCYEEEQISSLYDLIQKRLNDETVRQWKDSYQKLPEFWEDIETHVLKDVKKLANMKNLTVKLKKSAEQALTNRLFVQHADLKKDVTKKFGMKSLVDKVFQNMSRAGRVVWYNDSERTKNKLFLNPQLFYDLYFVLFRTDFMENFVDSFTQGVRSKLFDGNLDILAEENINALSERYITQGIMSLDLLKIIWLPLLLVSYSNSSQLILDILILFFDFFMLGYPLLPKDKLKQLWHFYYKMAESAFYEDSFLDLDKMGGAESASFVNHQITFDQIVIPNYLPVVPDDTQLNKANTELRRQCELLPTILTRLDAEYMNTLFRISQRYQFKSFSSSLDGLFETFSVNCLTNTDLYYKLHARNFIQAYNEENTIGATMYKEKHCLTFDFYLIAEPFYEKKPSDEGHPDAYRVFLFDSLWVQALRVLQLFEETLHIMYPSTVYERFSMCPECESFSLLGEWSNPKEIQRVKKRTCPGCNASVEISHLAKQKSATSLRVPRSNTASTSKF